AVLHLPWSFRIDTFSSTPEMSLAVPHLPYQAGPKPYGWRTPTFPADRRLQLPHQYLQRSFEKDLRAGVQTQALRTHPRVSLRKATTTGTVKCGSSRELPRMWIGLWFIRTLVNSRRMFRPSYSALSRVQLY